MLIDVYDAESMLSVRLDKVAAGEDVVTARHCRPIARLVPVAAGQEGSDSSWAHFKAEVTDKRLEKLNEVIRVTLAPASDATPLIVLRSQPRRSVSRRSQLIRSVRMSWLPLKNRVL